MVEIVIPFKACADIPQNPFDAFQNALRPDPVSQISNGLVGKDAIVPGPTAVQTLVYADYFGSGRAIRQIEDFMMESVLPYYSNTHTVSSYCGKYTTHLRERSRAVILEICGANSDDHAVLFAGSGATAGLNRLVHLFGIRKALADGLHPRVLIGPYEHHSNVLPWRESGAEVIEIPEGDKGGPDLDILRATLADLTGKGPIIGSFSAASNVTGICAQVPAVTRLVKAAGGKIVWDYAGGGPYLPIRMTPEPGVEIDAIVLSPHKFIGGPGASGLLIVRRNGVVSRIPSSPGGGTVAYVDGKSQIYLDRIENLEESGTPNILGDIRAGLVLLAKDAIGEDFIEKRNNELAKAGMAALRDHQNIALLAKEHSQRLPVFSFTVHDEDGVPVNHRDFTQELSTRYGIQARAGLACVGQYGHQLLNISTESALHYRREISAGNRGIMPGFVRINLSYLMDDSTVDFILRSVRELAQSMADAQRGCAGSDTHPRLSAIGGSAPTDGSLSVLPLGRDNSVS